MADVDRSTYNDRPGVTGAPVNRRWWAIPKEEQDTLPSTIAAIVSNIRDRSSIIETQRQLSAKLYGNLPVMGPAGISFNRTTQASPARDRITYNLIQSCIDTAVAKISKNKPKPYFLTNGGNYRERRKAKKLNRFVDGLFYECNSRVMAPASFRDGAVFGDGLIHVYAKQGRVAWERVLATEVFVDDVEGFYGAPQQMHRVKSLDRQVVIEMYPKCKEKILLADKLNARTSEGVQFVSDQIAVAESWHLPSGPKATDGRHIISVSTCVLLDEPYEKDFFPFARMRWSPRLWGFWSIGLAEQIQSLQLELNKLLWLVQRSYHLMGTFKIWMSHDSKIATEHLNNDIGTIIKGSVAPQYLTPQVVPAEYYAHIERIVRLAYDQSGVSQLSATSQKPAGLNSGKALREYSDIESDRWQTIGQAYEQLHLDLARLSISVVKDIVAEKKGKHEAGSYKVKSAAARFLSEIDWSEIDLDDDAYTMQVFPISSLPQDPAGRLQTVQEYAQAGFIDSRVAKKLLNFPDLEAQDSLASAVEERIEAALDAIVEGGEYVPPDPFMNLELARQMALEVYNAGCRDGLEEEKLEDLRGFMAQIDTELAAMAPPAPMLPDAGAPLANPTATPTSDLLPNTPQPLAA
jgi:hypothetical protein